MCLGKGTKTGKDVIVELNGRNLLEELPLTKIEWEACPEVCCLYLYPNKGTRRTIIYPIELLWIEFKDFTIKSNNTPKGTRIYFRDEELTGHSIFELSITISGADDINELTIYTG